MSIRVKRLSGGKWPRLHFLTHRLLTLLGVPLLARNEIFILT